jgi:GT2 family glycosyltransferase
VSVGEEAEVMVQNPDGPVGQPPGRPGTDDQGPHASNSNGVSVVICSRDRVELLRAALGAVAGVLRPDDELIVVDSASIDAGLGVAAAEAGAHVVRAAAPGLGRARNLGWRTASRPIVAFTDDDCAPAADWTAAVERTFADTSVGYVFGQVLAEGPGERLSTKASARAHRVDAGGDPTGLGHGANLSCRRSALEDISGFDDELGAGGRFPAAEDSDMAWRMSRAGWAGVFEPESVVWHRGWRDRNEALRVMFRYGVGAGAAAAKPAPVGSADRVRREVWDEGLRMAGRHLRSGYEFGVAAALFRAAGSAVGALRARRLSTDETGRFIS